MDENNNEFTQPLTEENSKKKKKKKGTFFKVIAVILACCIVGGLVAVGGQEIIGRYKSAGIRGIINPSAVDEGEETAENVPDIVIVSPDANSSDVKVGSEDKVDSDKDESKEKSSKASVELSASELYEQNVNAMVSISTSVTGYNAWGQKVQGAAAGSGFIITEDGYVLTNYHVIEDATAISVLTYDGESYDAKIIGFDETMDIAVLKIDGDDDFQMVTIGDSDACKVGEEVVAIGNALGEFDFSMTRGIISGLARNVQISTNLKMTLIQTDCTINSGNSGGALFNMKGEVIGITNAKYSSSGSYSEATIENVGFAIPMNSVIQIVEAIVSGKNLTTPYIGVSISNISTEVANATGISGGAYVQSVTEDSPAEKAGIQVGDIIVEANGQKIEDTEALSSFVSSCSPKDNVTFKIYRQGNEVEVDAVIGEMQNTNIVVGEEAENAFKEDESMQDQENGFSFSYGDNGQYGGNNGGSQYFGGYGSMPDIFSYIFGNYGY